MKLGTELFNSLKGFGYLIELYTEDGNGPIANPELAAYIYAKDKASQDSVMLRLPENESNEYSQVVVYKSEGIDDKLEKLLKTIKSITISYGSTVTIREFGKNIEPKDLAYLPKAKQEMEISSMNESYKNKYIVWISGGHRPDAKQTSRLIDADSEAGARKRVIKKYPYSKIHSIELAQGTDVNESPMFDSALFAVNPETGELVKKFSDKKSAEHFKHAHPNVALVNRDTFNKDYGWINDMVEDASDKSEGHDPVVTQPWYKNTIRETENYVAANVRFGIVLQNKHTGKNVFLQGDDATMMDHELAQLENASDEIFDHYVSQYETVMEDVVPFPSHKVKPKTLANVSATENPGSINYKLQWERPYKSHEPEEDSKLMKKKTRRNKKVEDDLKEDVVPFKGKPENDLKWFSTSSGRIEMQIRLSDAESVHHAGDCYDEIAALLKKPYINEQISKLNPETIAQELKEYGAWDAVELLDENMNKVRLLWVACGDISDRVTSGDYAESIDENTVALKKIPGSTLPEDEQDLLYRFAEKYTRPAEYPYSREEIDIRSRDGDIEVENLNRGMGISRWRRLGNEDMLLGKAFQWEQDSKSITEAAKYQRYGTSRSSYHVNPKAKNARVIIRHSKKVVDEGHGARSRNVKSLYVESLNGERRLIETKSLMCARAIANHVNSGGSLFDDTSNKILTLSEDIKKIRGLKKKYPISEDESNVKLHTSFNSILEGLSDFMKELNTSRASTLAEALNLSEPNVVFAKTFYSEKLGESYQDFAESLARGSVLYTKSRKFLPR